MLFRRAIVGVFGLVLCGGFAASASAATIWADAFTSRQFQLASDKHFTVELTTDRDASTFGIGDFIGGSSSSPGLGDGRVENGTTVSWQHLLPSDSTVNSAWLLVGTRDDFDFSSETLAVSLDGTLAASGNPKLFKFDVTSLLGDGQLDGLVRAAKGDGIVLFSALVVDLNRGGGGSGSPTPEPGGAVLFAVGALLVALPLRRQA